MSYQVIARKWRPQTFEEVTGQELITQTLKNAIEHDRLHHAYLFSGARGVGKTTTARLLAKALNCHKTPGPNIHPCKITDPEPCVSCIEIAESRSMDVLEIDAASNTGIDNVRDVIIDGINIIPARDRYKVFIIDEVHQLSKPAFNALLKTLEEPPRNVVFIMATTELHKVPDTILSRTQQFEFRTIPLPRIFDRLRLIADTEKINVADDALREIARSGEGSMRDAQSNFDQVISFAGEIIEVSDVVNALGLASVDMLTRVLDAIVESKPAEALAVVEELSARGQDFRNFCRDLLGLFRDLLVTKVGGDAELCETSTLSPAELTKRSAPFSESDLVRFFHSLADTETRIKDATQPRYVLEIGLVKLVEMRRLASVESVLERLAKLEGSIGSFSTPAKAAAATESVAQPPSTEKKTLKSDPSDQPTAKAAAIDEIQAVQPEIEEPLTSSIDLEFLKSMPVRLPPIPSEELEHIEDQWLDDAYERKLAFSGDDLSPITEIKSFVAELVHEIPIVLQTASAPNPVASTSAAVAMALSEIAESSVELETKLPVLGPEPTEQELASYARAHPAVRAALKVFRGKIVSVKRNPIRG
jgi:DNA polymerase-3 subunit gamma/tau